MQRGNRNTAASVRLDSTLNDGLILPDCAPPPGNSVGHQIAREYANTRPVRVWLLGCRKEALQRRDDANEALHDGPHPAAKDGGGGGAELGGWNGVGYPAPLEKKRARSVHTMSVMQTILIKRMRRAEWPRFEARL